MTNAELEAELAKLTPEERVALIAELEAKDSTFAGQAVSTSIAAKYKISTKVAGVSKVKVITVAKRIQVKRIQVNTHSAKVVARLNELACTDSDDNPEVYLGPGYHEENVYVKGTVVGHKFNSSEMPLPPGSDYVVQPGGKVTVSDYCLNAANPSRTGTHVVEYECGIWNKVGIDGVNHAQYPIIRLTTVLCPNGCSDGACLPAPN